MSISVDDLVASLSSNHIGQEAIDLATLQVITSQNGRYAPLLNRYLQGPVDAVAVLSTVPTNHPGQWTEHSTDAKQCLRAL
jgi:hypothetical protein